MANIVLIGMPGCGKSTVGALLAAALHMDFVDTDIVLQRPQGDNSYPNKDKTRNGILLIVDGDQLEDDADGIMDHIYIENCYIHDVDGPNDWNDTFTGGINFNVIGSTIRPNTSFRDLRIANNTIRKVDL